LLFLAARFPTLEKRLPLFRRYGSLPSSIRSSRERSRYGPRCANFA
jgi:hypothetical protein